MVTTKEEAGELVEFLVTSVQRLRQAGLTKAAAWRIAGMLVELAINQEDVDPRETDPTESGTEYKEAA